MWLGILVVVLAVVSTALTSLFTKLEWDGKTKNLVAVIFSSIAGGVLVATTGGLGALAAPADFLTLSTSVYGASQLVYKFLLQGTTVDNALTTAVVKNKDTVEYYKT